MGYSLHMLNVDSLFFMLNLSKFFFNWVSHFQGPGEQVDLKLGEVHQEHIMYPQIIFFQAKLPNLSNYNDFKGKQG